MSSAAWLIQSSSLIKFRSGIQNRLLLFLASFDFANISFFTTFVPSCKKLLFKLLWHNSMMMNQSGWRFAVDR